LRTKHGPPTELGPITTDARSCVPVIAAAHPVSLPPQGTARPSRVTAHVSSWPTAIDTTSATPTTGTGLSARP